MKNSLAIDQVLTLRKKSCYCILVEVERKPIPRGAQVTLRPGTGVWLRLASSLPVKPGQHAFSVVVAVAGANGKPGQVMLRLVVPVYADIALQPRVVRHEFSASHCDAVQEHVVVTRTLRGREVKPEPPRLSGLPPFVTLLSVTEQGPPVQVETGLWQSSWNLNLRIEPRPDLMSADVTHPVSVGFSGSRDHGQNVVNLPFIIRRRSGIDAPRKVALGTVVLGQSRVRRLLIRALDDRDFNVIKTATSSKMLRATVVSPSAARRHWIDLLCESGRQGAFRETITVYTDHPDCTRIDIVVKGLVVKQEGRSATLGSPTEAVLLQGQKSSP
ncbi:MAG: hypothetical protein JW818_02160 [Pirellulales bacterium]|nr:hypothetical protein [Pirellulales bacterium]